MTKQADEERTGFDDWLPVRAEYIAPGEYKIVTCGGLPLWYMEGAALSEWICERINAIPDPGAVSGQASIEGIVKLFRRADAEDKCVCCKGDHVYARRIDILGNPDDRADDWLWRQIRNEDLEGRKVRITFSVIEEEPQQ